MHKELLFLQLLAQTTYHLYQVTGQVPLMVSKVLHILQTDSQPPQLTTGKQLETSSQPPQLISMNQLFHDGQQHQLHTSSQLIVAMHSQPLLLTSMNQQNLAGLQPLLTTSSHSVQHQTSQKEETSTTPTLV